MATNLPAEDAAALKTAWSQTVRQLGGNAATSSVTGADSAQISRYGSLHDACFAPVHVVLAAERCAVQQHGHPFLIAALSRAIGHELVPVQIGEGDIAKAAEQVAITSGKLLGDTVRALADGVIDANERLLLCAGLDELRHVATVMRGRLMNSGDGGAGPLRLVFAS